MSDKTKVLLLDKKTKIMIIVAAALAALMFVFYIMLGLVENQIPEEVVYPSGQLSNSVFDLQNMNYSAVNEMSLRYEFVDMPYTIDVVEGDMVSINGANIIDCEPYFFYYSVINQKDELKEALCSHLTEVLCSGADSLLTEVEILVTEEGYINGCLGTFVVAKLEVHDTQPSYICLYRLHVDESFYASENDLIVGCMTSTFSTQSLAELQGLLYLSVGTLRYDAEKAEILQKS